MVVKNDAVGWKVPKFNVREFLIHFIFLEPVLVTLMDD